MKDTVIAPYMLTIFCILVAATWTALVALITALSQVSTLTRQATRRRIPWPPLPRGARLGSWVAKLPPLPCLRLGSPPWVLSPLAPWGPPWWFGAGVALPSCLRRRAALLPAKLSAGGSGVPPLGTPGDASPQGPPPKRRLTTRMLLVTAKLNGLVFSTTAFGAQIKVRRTLIEA